MVTDEGCGVVFEGAYQLIRDALEANLDEVVLKAVLKLIPRPAQPAYSQRFLGNRPCDVVPRRGRRTYAIIYALYGVRASTKLRSGPESGPYGKCLHL